MKYVCVFMNTVNMMKSISYYTVHVYSDVTVIIILTDMLSESGDAGGGWIPYCSHDPIQLVAPRSPTPTHR